METGSTLIESGINLLLTGMVVVFLFPFGSYCLNLLIEITFSQNHLTITLLQFLIRASKLMHLLIRVHERIIHESNGASSNMTESNKIGVTEVVLTRRTSILTGNKI